MHVLCLGHCHHGDMESAEGMLLLMEQSGISPKETSYTALMCGHADTGDMGGIEKVRLFLLTIICITHYSSTVCIGIAMVFILPIVLFPGSMPMLPSMCNHKVNSLHFTVGIQCKGTHSLGIGFSWDNNTPKATEYESMWDSDLPFSFSVYLHYSCILLARALSTFH